MRACHPHCHLECDTCIAVLGGAVGGRCGFCASPPQVLYPLLPSSSWPPPGLPPPSSLLPSLPRQGLPLLTCGTGAAAAELIGRLLLSLDADCQPPSPTPPLQGLLLLTCGAGAAVAELIGRLILSAAWLATAILATVFGAKAGAGAHSKGGSDGHPDWLLSTIMMCWAMFLLSLAMVGGAGIRGGWGAPFHGRQRRAPRP